MNNKAKRRLIVVTLLIVAIAVIILAVVGGSSSAKALTVAEAASGEYNGKRVQVSGTVVDNSFSTTADGLSFDIYDPDASQTVKLHVFYEGSAPETFGNGIVAISTGTMQDDGSLLASEMVTKCPSKYESADGALTVSNLKDCGNSVIGEQVKLAGYIKKGTLVSAAAGGDRFTLYSQSDEISVIYDGAMPDGVDEESSVVVTGSLDSDGKFEATDVAAQQVG